MPLLLLKEVPRFECLLERSRQYPDLDPSATEAFLHLFRTGTELQEAFATVHANHRISRGRFVVLMLLSHGAAKPINLADLAEQANVTRATMTGLVDTLERDGYAKRAPASEDRRMMLVRLTDAGRAFVDSILPDYLRRIAALMAGLSEAERKELVALMIKVQQSMPAVNQ